MDVGTTGCYIAPKYAHVRLHIFHVSYNVNVQPALRPWRSTACRQAISYIRRIRVVVHGPLHFRIRILTGPYYYMTVYGHVDILLCNTSQTVLKSLHSDRLWLGAS